MSKVKVTLCYNLQNLASSLLTGGSVSGSSAAGTVLLRSETYRQTDGRTDHDTGSFVGIGSTSL